MNEEPISPYAEYGILAIKVLSALKTFENKHELSSEQKNYIKFATEYLEDAKKHKEMMDSFDWIGLLSSSFPKYRSALRASRSLIDLMKEENITTIEEVFSRTREYLDEILSSQEIDNEARKLYWLKRFFSTLKQFCFSQLVLPLERSPQYVSLNS